MLSQLYNNLSVSCNKFIVLLYRIVVLLVANLIWRIGGLQQNREIKNRQ